MARTCTWLLLGVMSIAGALASGGPALASEGDVDLRDVPGPWENHVVTLPSRGDDGAPFTMHYLAAGPKGAPTVVLLHGFPDFSYGWRDVIPLLSQDFRVLAPDLRGYAGTDVTREKEGYLLANLAGDIVEFLDQTALEEGRAPQEKVHLMTHDWGTSVGWELATFHPTRLLSFTAMDVPQPVAFADFARASKEQRKYFRFVRQMTFFLTPRILAGMSLEKRRAVYEDILSTATISDEELALYQAVYSDVDRCRGPLMYYKSLKKNKKDIEARYRQGPKVSIPTLVLWGEDDGYMLAEQAPMSCEHVEARCEVKVFPQANHQLPWDAPEGIVEQWRGFVGGE